MKSVPSLLSLLLLGLLTAKAEPVRGIVTAVDAKSGTLTLQQEGSTSAPVTAFTVSGDLISERIGTVVAAELKESGGIWRFEKLVPADTEGERLIAAAADRLHADTRERARSTQRDVGDGLPEIALRDQYGRTLTNADLKGRYVVISFIFTRCRTPEMCPASTRKMVELSQKLKTAGVTNALLLSISFDPTHDTPGVLNTYADAYHADRLVHRFLTGPKGAIEDLQRQFGILTVEDDGTLVHNVATTLVSPAGRILHRADGPRWTVDDILIRIQRHRSAK